MACFIVPATEAIVATIATKVVESRERKLGTVTQEECKQTNGVETLESVVAIPFSRKLKWLSNMLWGGSLLLAFEHIWHGEVTAWFPFVTAADSPEGVQAMLGEMATTGVLMAVLVTAVWGGMLVVTKVMEKEAQHTSLHMQKN